MKQQQTYYSHTCHMGADIYTYYKFNGKEMKIIAEKCGDDTYRSKYLENGI